MWHFIMSNKPHLIPCIIAILLLVGSLGKWPYGYYILLRFVVCGASAYTAYLSYSNRITWAAWVFGIMAILFNPIVPFHLGRELWQIVDFISVIIFVIGIVVVKKSYKNTDSDTEI